MWPSFTNDMTAQSRNRGACENILDGTCFKGRDIETRPASRHLHYYASVPPTPPPPNSPHPPPEISPRPFTPEFRRRLNGNPYLTGAIVCKTFYGNGNTIWHTIARSTRGDAVDYRIVSYVEDIR